MPSQAQTYQHHPTNKEWGHIRPKNNGNPFINPPSSVHPHHISRFIIIIIQIIIIIITIIDHIPINIINRLEIKNIINQISIEIKRIERVKSKSRKKKYTYNVNYI